MENPVPFLSGAQREILVAAAGGSILSLLFVGEAFSWRMALTALLSGMFSAYYGVQLVADMMSLSPGYLGALGAAFGLGTMTVLGGFFTLMRSWRDDPAAFIARFIPYFRKDGK